MKIWTVPRMFSVYLGDSFLHPKASAQVFQYANRGQMFSISGGGSGFIEHFGEIMQKCKREGVDSLEGPMVPEVAELIREKVESLGGGFEYDGEAPMEHEGEPVLLPWVKVYIP